MTDGGVRGLFYRRVVSTLNNSFKGLRVCMQQEEAFRVEVLLSLVFLPIAVWLATGAIQFILLAGSILLVLITELLNSGLEAVVDRVGLEHNELSGRAKDMGSAAVLLSIVLFLLIWVTIIATNLS